MNDSNIIKFPKQFARNVPSFEEVQQGLEFQKINQIADVSGALVGEVLQALTLLGYDFPVSTKAEKDFYLVAEAIRAMIGKYHDEEHPFHHLAEHSFEVLDEDGSFIFLAPSIEVTLRKEEDADDSA
jgi:hypothetical protein